MSLRREEAELRRVLDLSTQQANALAYLSPVQLSSAPTDDSRDFELRPFHGSAAGTSGTAMSTPIVPELPRSHRILSPDDDDDGDVWSPVQHSANHVASPRYIRGDSPDPIDAFQVNDNNRRAAEGNRAAEVLAGNDMPSTTTATSSTATATSATTTTTIGSSQTRGEAACKPSPHSNATSHPSLSASTSSPAEESGRRQSARVQSIQEKKEAQAAERKRKRAERKAREAAEKAATGTPTTSQPSVDPEAEGAEHRRKKRAKTSGQQRNVASKATSQSSSIDGQAVTTNGTHVDPSPPKRASVTPQPEHPPPSSDGPADRPSPERQDSPKFVSPRHARSPVKDQPSDGDSGAVVTAVSTGVTASTPLPSRRPLEPAHNTPTNSSTPNGGRWRTPRNDLAGVLSRFPKAKATGMSRRLKIVPLHSNIGPGVKALPPPPPRTKKKVEEEDDEDDEDEDGNPKIKVGSREWLMMED